MVAREGGRITLTAAEAAIVAAVRAAESGYAEQGKRVETYTRAARGPGATGLEVVTVVGPDRLVRGLVDAGVLTATLTGLVQLGPAARA